MAKMVAKEKVACFKIVVPAETRVGRRLQTDKVKTLRRDLLLSLVLALVVEPSLDII